MGAARAAPSRCVSVVGEARLLTMINLAAADGAISYWNEVLLELLAAARGDPRGRHGR